MPAKPESCVSCGAFLEHAATGRPRSYCGPACRRLAERKLRVAEQLLARARKAEQSARCKAATDGYGWSEVEKTAQWWAGEVDRCEAELAVLLAGSDDGEDESASVAAATLARRRRPQ